MGLAMVTMGCVGAVDDIDPASMPDSPASGDSPEITKVQERNEFNFTIDEGPSDVLESDPTTSSKASA